MSMLMIRCPATGTDVSTGIEVEPEMFSDLPDVRRSTTCSACGKVHRWWTHEAFLSAKGVEGLPADRGASGAPGLAAKVIGAIKSLKPR